MIDGNRFHKCRSSEYITGLIPQSSTKTQAVCTEPMIMHFKKLLTITFVLLSTIFALPVVTPSNQQLTKNLQVDKDSVTSLGLQFDATDKLFVREVVELFGRGDDEKPQPVSSKGVRDSPRGVGDSSKVVGDSSKGVRDSQKPPDHAVFFDPATEKDFLRLGDQAKLARDFHTTVVKNYMKTEVKEAHSATVFRLAHTGGRLADDQLHITAAFHSHPLKPGQKPTRAWRDRHRILFTYPTPEGPRKTSREHIYLEGTVPPFYQSERVMTNGGTTPTVTQA